jgi:hypothetical protein
MADAPLTLENSPFVERGKDGVWRSTELGFYHNHLINDVHGGDWVKPATGERGRIVPKRDRACKHCNPKTWRLFKFLYLLRVNPKCCLTPFWRPF